MPRYKLRTLLIVLAAFGGCGGPDSSEVGQGLEAKLQNATQVVIAYSELNGESNVAYEITEPAEVQRLIPLLASRRGWKEIPEGAWSATRIAFVEFRNSEGVAIWNCTLLTNSMEIAGKDDRHWLAEWRGGLDRVMSVAKRGEPASPDRP